MKILRLNSIVSFRGGAEAYIENVSKMLSELGHENLTITFLSGEGGPSKPEFVDVVMSSNPISRFVRDSIAWNDIVNFLNGKVSEFKPDIIHLHHLRNASASVAKFIQMTNLPVVFTAHDALWACPLSTLVQPGGKICDGGTGIRCGFTGCKIQGHLTYELLLASKIRKLANSRINAILCPSYSVMDYLHNNGFSPTVHLPSFSKFEEGVRNEEPLFGEILQQKSIGYIGRLESYKGVQDLIEAFSLFVKMHPDFRLKIAGIGSYEKELKKVALNLGMDDHIVWLGKLDSKAREKFYRGVSVIVVPSNYWENFALVAQEALLRGIPVIGTNIGGIPEIVKADETGRIVPISSPGKISEALEDVFSNTEKTLKLMKKGREFILNSINPEAHLNGLLRVYYKVLSGETIRDLSEATEL